mmetsp:Transcript_29659/g.88656  ORF Transcript_29659/g.88656 Transcript_29659/m.88656 type:complete len:236 (+) Transcript_29659:428-1135(+)
MRVVCSTMRTSAPASASVFAAVRPLAPAPTTSTRPSSGLVAASRATRQSRRHAIGTDIVLVAARWGAPMCARRDGQVDEEFRMMSVAPRGDTRTAVQVQLPTAPRAGPNAAQQLAPDLRGSRSGVPAWVPVRLARRSPEPTRRTAGTTIVGARRGPPSFGVTLAPESESRRLRRLAARVAGPWADASREPVAARAAADDYSATPCRYPATTRAGHADDGGSAPSRAPGSGFPGCG